MKGRSATNVARIFMDNTDHVMTAAYQELKDAMQFKRVNEELLEYLSSSIRWLLHYSKKNNIPLPEKDKIHKSLTELWRLQINCREIVITAYDHKMRRLWMRSR